MNSEIKYTKYSKTCTPCRFGFNGMMRMDDVKDLNITAPLPNEGVGNTYDFGARLYDPRLARWFSLDIARALYPSTSPYTFALNTPVNAIDPDGKLVMFVSGYRPGHDRVSGGLKGDQLKYWGKDFVNAAVERLVDNNTYFFDGNGGIRTSHEVRDVFTLGIGTENPGGFEERKQLGRDDAKALLSKIEAGEVTLRAKESIKIFAHSMGYAHAEGMAEEFIKAGKTVGIIYAVAPEGSQFGRKPFGVGKVKQYWGTDDKIVGSTEIEGVDEFVPIKSDHSIKNFIEIFKIKEGERGYVEPRKDKHEPDKEKE